MAVLGGGEGVVRGGGGILEKFDPCGRPCAVLVQCLERLVHLGFAMGHSVESQISGIIKPTQPYHRDSLPPKYRVPAFI